MKHLSSMSKVEVQKSCALKPLPWDLRSAGSAQGLFKKARSAMLGPSLKNCSLHAGWMDQQRHGHEILHVVLGRDHLMFQALLSKHGIKKNP